MSFEYPKDGGDWLQGAKSSSVSASDASDGLMRVEVELKAPPLRDDECNSVGLTFPALALVGLLLLRKR